MNGVGFISVAVTVVAVVPVAGDVDATDDCNCVD